MVRAGAHMAGKFVIVINQKDNVATALETLGAGRVVQVEIQGRLEEVTLLSEIPMGHKFALRDIEDGGLVIKYGETIGRSRAKIKRGAHVHVHNVVSPVREGEGP
jgi:altronate dehydratase small subunit